MLVVVVQPPVESAPALSLPGATPGVGPTVGQSAVEALNFAVVCGRYGLVRLCLILSSVQVSRHRCEQ